MNTPRIHPAKKPPYFVTVIVAPGVRRVIDFNKYETFPEYFKQLVREQYPMFFNWLKNGRIQ